MPASNLIDARRQCRDYYARNRAVQCAKAIERKKARSEVARLHVLEVKKSGCIDCGEDDPIVLDFDHRDRRSKHKTVSALVAGGYALATVKDEIEKCDLRCANCHRRRSHREEHFRITGV